MFGFLTSRGYQRDLEGFVRGKLRGECLCRFSLVTLTTWSFGEGVVSQFVHLVPGPKKGVGGEVDPPKKKKVDMSKER